MANADKPNGFHVISSSPRRGKYTVGATAVKEGDPVMLYEGLVKFYDGTEPLLGVMAADAAADATDAVVFDDLASTEFYAQFEGTYSAATPGNCFDIKGTTGITEINGAAEAYGNVEVLGLYPIAGSTETGSNAKVRCRLIRDAQADGSALLDPFLGVPGTETTATGSVSITRATGKFVKIDPGGSARDVTLAASLNRHGAWLNIMNAADAAENLTIKNSAGSTLGVLNQNQGCWAVNLDGTASGWKLLGYTAVVDLSS